MSTDLMRVLMVAAEAAPFVSSGSLGQTVGALARALATLGHKVDLVLPRYRGMPAGQPAWQVAVTLGGQRLEATLCRVRIDGVDAVLVDQPVYFDRDYLYGAGGHDYADNPERFAFLCQAALDWALASGNPYDVAHMHDWHTGLFPVLLGRTFRAHTGLRRLPTVFTVHNVAYQGLADASWLPRLGLGWDLLRVDALEYWGRISLLKSGVVFSRLITTVSPQYAREIQTPALGHGFDGILRQRSGDLIGILNGIDYDQWDPETDSNLPEPFGASNLAGKAASKLEVLRAYGLPADPQSFNRPLIGLVSGLSEDKGFDLLEVLADELSRLGAAFAQLGTGERRFEDLWLALAARYPSSIGSRTTDDDRLAHLIYAGADVLLIPSRVEPDGIAQLCALRYGTVPVVRATGGLGDAVRNFDAATGSGTGFSFDEYSAQALLNTLRWALSVFADRPTWRRIQQAGMREDFSWRAAARRYVSAYQRAAAPSVWA